MVAVQHGEFPDWMVGPMATVLAIIVLTGAIFWTALHVAAQMKVERIKGWFQRWASAMRSIKASRSVDFLQTEDREVGLVDAVSRISRKKKPGSLLRRIANQKRVLGGLLNFFIAEEIEKGVDVEMGPFDLEDSAWLKITPTEVVASATQHFIGDEDALHCSPRPRDLSVDAFALGDEAWHMRNDEAGDQATSVP